MKTVLIPVLLLFGICSGFSIQKIQQKQSEQQEIDGNQTKVYEVKEGDRTTVRVVYPKPEKPTRREIVYFHVIETPYGSQREDKLTEDAEGPDFDQTRRPFTNGHGFQFLDEDPEIIDKSENKLHGPEGNDKDEEILDSDSEEDAVTLLEDEEEPETSDNEDVIESAEEEIVEQDEDVTEKTEEKEVEATTEKIHASKRTTTVPPMIFRKTDETIKTDGLENKSARNALFSQVRNKYQNRRHTKTPERRRRDISYKDLPPAPTLPPLNLDILPDYIRKVIAPKLETTSKPPQHDDLTNFNENDFKEELAHKIEDMISSLKPKYDDDEDDDDDYEYQDGNGYDTDDEDREDIESEYIVNKRVPRTYGMNLTMGQGYVWNDLSSEPGMPGISYDVGKSEDNIEDDKDETSDRPASAEKLEATEIPETATKPILEPTNIPHLTESNLIDKEDSNSKESSQDISGNDVDKETDEGMPNKETMNHADLEDIEVNKFVPKLLSNEKEEEIEEKRKNVNNKTKDEEKVQVTPITPDWSSTESKIDEQDNSERKPGRTKDNSNYSKQNIKNNKHKENKKYEDLFKELMNNEEFWKWLGDWTATYMELLMKHIKRMVHDEVARQVKTLAASLNKDSPPVVSKNNNNTSKTETANDNKENKEDFGKNAIKLVDNCKNMDNSDKTKKPDKSQYVDKTIFIDNTAIPITHNTNFDLTNLNKEEKCKNKTDFDKKEINSLKHRKDNDDRKDTKDPDIATSSNKDSFAKSPINITANNIFGNSAGSDQVTNIFIFYPPHDKNNNIVGTDSTKPFSNGANNTYYFGSNDKVDIDKRHPELTSQKDESTMTEPKPNNEATVSTDAKLDDAKPNDANRKNEKENKKENNEETHTVPETATLKNDIEKTEVINDKKENSELIDEHDTKTDTAIVGENNLHSVDIASVVDNATVINTDTTTVASLEDNESPKEKPEGQEGHVIEPQITTHEEQEKELQTGVKKEIEKQLEKELNKEVANELNKELSKEIEKELEREPVTLKEEEEKKPKEESSEKDSDKKEAGEVIVQA